MNFLVIDAAGIVTTEPKRSFWQRLRRGLIQARAEHPSDASAAEGSSSKPSLNETDWLALKQSAPTPVFWLLGKTQSGKSSVIRYLTQADDIEIGNGYQPCTRTSRKYQFPSDAAPLITFLDTRGLDEPSYDPREDLASFQNLAHLVIVTVRLKDFATGRLREVLTKVRKADSARPILLVLTCLHEAYPQEQHPPAYPFFVAQFPLMTKQGDWPEQLLKLVERQAKEFSGLIDAIVPIDFTLPEEGYEQIHYGGEALKQALQAYLPAALRANFSRIIDADTTAANIELRRVRAIILGHATLAGAAACLPWTHGLMVLKIQERMLHEIGLKLGRVPEVNRFLNHLVGWNDPSKNRTRLANFLGLSPARGLAADSRMAAKTTYALGQAFVVYLRQTKIHSILSDAQIHELYREQLATAQQLWDGNR